MEIASTKEAAYPLVSVIIPAYNAEDTIERCLDSVMAQTYPNLEIIVVNDGSTDCTEELLRVYVRNGAPINIVNQQNKGVSSARNHGVEIANGKYIGFIDADDDVDSDYIEAMVEQFDSSGRIGLVACRLGGETESASHRDTVEVKTIAGQLTIIKQLYFPEGIGGYVWGRLFQTDVIRKNGIEFPTGVHMCEDSLFCCRYCKQIDCIRIIERPLYHYEMRNSGATKMAISERRFSVLDAYDGVIAELEPIWDESLRRRVLLNYTLHCFRLVRLSVGDKGRTNEYLSRTLERYERACLAKGILPVDAKTTISTIVLRIMIIGWHIKKGMLQAVQR